MKKERKITAPEGCEIDKVELVDGVAVVTFKEKKRELPKSWEEFCDNFPVNPKEFYVDDFSRVLKRTDVGDERDKYKDKNKLPDRAIAEGVLALCQLIQLRNAYNGDWVPDWEDDYEDKHMIYYYRNRCCVDFYQNMMLSPLYFKTAELRDKFLRNFSQLIEKLKPLYGIKEGGAE